MSAAQRELIVASQFDPKVNAVLAQRAGVTVRDLAPGPLTELPQGAGVLFALPAPKGQTLLQTPATPGWNAVRWVQLASVGIDFYPPWLFDGPVVTSARGSSALALAEFALAAIFSAAKRQPDIWIDRADRWSPTPLAIVEGQTLGIV